MTRLEYLTCRGTGRRHRPRGARRRHPLLPPDRLERGRARDYRARFGGFGKRIHALPDSYRRIATASRSAHRRAHLAVIVGTGHSPEHACLYCPGLKLLISGDQVLPRISSNVSVHPTEPDANPMVDWLDSLGKIRAEVPDDVLVLPAHNEPFRGLHARLDSLASGQQRTLARLRKTLAEPRRTVDVFTALFGRAIGDSDNFTLNLATGESQACLNYLLQRGEPAASPGTGSPRSGKAQALRRRARTHGSPPGFG
jgi:glyoxylase-like metal-dependent hydrolase (beta-lactamase superfamily II)